MTNSGFGTSEFDVVICGGGLAGLTLARQIRRELPSLRVALIDRMRRPLPEAGHKVGESSVELACSYFRRLGLEEYILDRHLIKFGLRFLPGGGELPIELRREIGPSQEPPVNSYQLDRGRLENDLRDMNEADGVTMLEGYAVRDVTLAESGTEGAHLVNIVKVAAQEEAEGGAVTPEKRSISTRWVVDATGRNGMFRKKLKLKRGTGHAANAGWFRVKGRVDVTSFVPNGPDATEAQKAWHSQPFAGERWRSTTHFMGSGYWVWFIPLSSGNTSIGIVVHDELHPFTKVNTLEAALEFLRRHEPALAPIVEQLEVIDFCCLRDYSHNAARCWSTERWALVGEAGAFVDPLYSPGSDFIAFANSFTAELIRCDYANSQGAKEDFASKVQQLNLQYRALVAGGVGVFRVSAPVYGHARGMAAKIYWDNYAYWSFPCQYYLQDIYRTTGPIHTDITMTGARFVELSGYLQDFFRAWAELHPEQPQPGFLGLPQFPSMLVQAHLDLRKQMTPDETLQFIRGQLVNGELLAVELVLRVLFEVGPEAGGRLLERAGASRWHMAVDRARLDAEALGSLARRKALPEISLDVERNLGRVEKHPGWREAAEVFIQILEGDKAASTLPTGAPAPIPEAGTGTGVASANAE